ncbi:MAG: SWIM zinc finger family protein [Oscillospiraceae bacterium]|nr:SWIM zinc finger family protein [Oscillospiraceae bacterium]
MSTLQQALAEADENYFIGISNKGIYKRAGKDLEEADISAKYQEDSAEIKISGETCLIKNPLWESTCSCPSRSICRHLIASMLWLKEHFQSEDTDNDAEFEPDFPEDEMLPAGLPETLRQELSQVTVPQIKKAMGSQLKTLLPNAGQVQLEESSILSGTLPDGTAVRLLYPLQNSTCACHKKDLCPHKALVILAWQMKENLISLSNFETQAKTLSNSESLTIQESAGRSYALLCDVLRWGLVRMPENMAEHLEASAVQSHALRMADAEKMLRDLGSRLSDCRERRAVFHADNFMKKLCECAGYLHQLQTQSVSEEMLGQFRRSYETFGQDLTILPIGQRTVNNSEYAGEIYYFLNLDEKSETRFLTFSDIRPVFYENAGNSHRRDVVIPWNAGAPIKSLMKSKMILKNAKISDGKLSGSKDTMIAMKSPANLNCPELQKHIYTDFRKLAIDSAQNQNHPENLCFIHPTACISSVFDTYAQRYKMEIADNQGNSITMQVRYQAETKDFISLLEKIGKEMLSHPEKIYTWLCTAYFENGQLSLFPIEVYDFIEIPEQKEFILPQKYAETNSVYANQILQLLQEIQDYLCALIQSGLQSASQANSAKFAEKARNSGMQGLSDLLTKFSQSAEAVRHSMQDNITEVMQDYTAIQNYIRIGLEKLEVLCALEHMKPKGTQENPEENL